MPPPEKDPSEALAAFVNQTAAMLGLILAAEHQPGVAANFALLQLAAAPLLVFSLPLEAEAAPVFEP